jgi:uncharacterized damage-inducible protein DinB
MISFFQYNWLVRDEWFDLCSRVPYEELIKERTGGFKTILLTMLHIVNVEEGWIADIKGVPVRNIDLSDYKTIESIKKFSDEIRSEVERVVRNWSPDMDYETILCPIEEGKMEEFTYGEILRHVIAHEIHHIGQLSVWAREIGIQPVSANLIRRGLFTE